MDKHDQRFFRDLGLMMVGVVTVVAIGIWLAVLGGTKWCNVTGEKMGVAAQYEFWTGCMIKVNDRWIPIETYREMGK